MKTITQSAPGKLVISGEYAVLEGYQAIACAVNRWVHCTYTPNKSTSISTFTGSAGDQEKNSDFVQEIFASARESELEIPVGHYHIDSSELYFQGRKLGLGSSAAVCVALVRTVAAASRLNLDDEALFRLCLRAHRKLFAGLGSGIDIAACCAIGTFIFQISADSRCPRRQEISCVLSELPMIGVFTGQSQSTASFITQFKALKVNQPEFHSELVKGLSVSNELLTVALLEKNINLLVDAVKLVGDRLADLGAAMKVPLLSEAHQKIAAIAIECQGAAKISGAGGGDMSICVAPSQHRHLLASRLREAGFHVLDSLFL